MTKKITLLCAAGMSTSLLVNKMKQAAEKKKQADKEAGQRLKKIKKQELKLALATELANNYPFKITVTITPRQIDAQYGEATYEIKVTWAFESGDDSADTSWGENAYAYKQNNPTESSIKMTLRLLINQTNS